MTKKQSNNRKKQRRERQRREKRQVRSHDTHYNRADRLHYLIAQGKMEEARYLVLDLVEQRPKDQHLHDILAQICQEVGDTASLLWTAERLIALDPKDFNGYAYRFNSAISAKMPAVAIETVKAMERIPHDQEYDTKIKKFLAAFSEKELAAEFRRESAEAGDDFSDYDDETILSLLANHERSLFYLHNQKFNLAVEICDNIIRSFPIFRSAYNNKALAILLWKGAEKAGPALDEALTHHPDNVFALSFKIQQLVKLGLRDELPPLLGRLKATQPWKPKGNLDFFSAKMEAFAWAGEEEALLTTYNEAKADTGDDWQIESSHACAHMAFLAGVAHALRGEVDEAAVLLRQAVRCPEISHIAMRNRDDLRKSEGERNGPWYFDVDDWIPQRFFMEMVANGELHRILGDSATEDEEERKRLVERYLFPLYTQAYKRWPYLRSLRIEMLDRGGQDTRDWIMVNIGDYPDTEFVDALKTFSAGQKGTDAFRLQILNTLGKLKLMKPGVVRRWHGGKQTEQYIFGFEIHCYQDKTQTRLSNRGIDILTEAADLIGKYKLDRAIEMLEKLDAKEPNDPSVLYNIAVCKEAQGKKDEFRLMIERLLSIRPNYFFARVAKAKCLAVDKRFGESFEIFTELLGMSSLHVSEAVALIGALTVYHLAKGEVEAANSLFQMGQSMFPDRFSSWKQLRSEAGLSGGLSWFLSSLQGKSST